MSFVANLIKQEVNPNTFLDNLNPENIYSEDTFNACKYSAFTFIEELDYDGARGFANKLEKILTALLPKGQKEQAIFDVLYYWFLRLKVFSIRTMPQLEQTELFKKYVVGIFSYGLNLRQAIFSYIDIFSSGDVIEETTKGFLTGFTSSEAVLGQNLNSLKNNNFKPTVSNWLKEYQSVLRSLGSGMKLQPGAFHIVKFLDSNQYVKYLSLEEKEILRGILDLYNWLLEPVVYADEKSQGNNSAYTNTQRLVLPKEILEPLPASLPPKIPPVIPAPKNAPTLKPFAEISNQPKQRGNNPLSFIPSAQGGSASGGNPLPKPTLPPFSTVLPKKPVSEPQGVNEPRKYAPANLPEEPVTEEFGRVNFQDILKERKQGEQNSAGLTMSDGQDRKQEFLKTMADKQASMVKNQGTLSGNNPPSIIPNSLPTKQDVQKREQDKAADIDRKLEELSKRIK